MAFDEEELDPHGECAAEIARLRAALAALIEPADAMHRLALQRIDKLLDAAAGSPEGDELNSLSEAVASYERARL